MPREVAFASGEVGTECGGGAETGERYLHTHGQGQLVAGEPLGDGFRNGDTGDFTAHAEDGEA